MNQCPIPCKLTKLPTSPILADDYIELCEEAGKEPEMPFKGSFNVPTGTDLHRRAALVAKSKGMNLNKIVTDTLENYLSTVEGA